MSLKLFKDTDILDSSLKILHNIITSAIPEPVNLLSNGDFEDGTTDWYNWKFPDKLPLSNIHIDTPGRDGTGSCIYLPNIISGEILGHDLPKQAGDYEVSFWIKTPYETDTIVVVVNEPYVFNELLTGSTDWVQLTISFTLVDPITDPILFFMMEAYCMDCLIDDVVLVEV